jgi:hypothetical protein
MPAESTGPRYAVPEAWQQDLVANAIPGGAPKRNEPQEAR